jgi:hypothetical protein
VIVTVGVSYRIAFRRSASGLPENQKERPGRCRGVLCGQELYRKTHVGFAKVAAQWFSFKLRLQEFLLWTKMVEQLPSLLE